MAAVFPGAPADKPGVPGNFCSMGEAALNWTWEQVSTHARRCRLPFCDVTVGLVATPTAVVLIDTGTTLREARAVADDVRLLTGRDVGHLILTHHHFDHILGHSVFTAAQTYCAPAVIAALDTGSAQVRAEALSHGADAAEVDRALAASVPIGPAVTHAVLDLGDVTVRISHPGRGHTDHDLIVLVSDIDRPVVFCGDLVEESGEPCVDHDSDLQEWPTTLDRVLAAGGPSAAYVPGHGAVVDAEFVRRQADWLARR